MSERKYIRFGVYKPEEVLPFFTGVDDGAIKDYDGIPVYTFSTRYFAFRKSLVCQECGLEGTFFALERAVRDHTNKMGHFNLYGINANGQEVMLTQEHIIPKSCGGPDTDENLITTCYTCNKRKSNKIDLDYAVRHGMSLKRACELVSEGCERLNHRLVQCHNQMQNAQNKLKSEVIELKYQINKLKESEKNHRMNSANVTNTLQQLYEENAKLKRQLREEIRKNTIKEGVPVIESQSNRNRG